MIRYHRPLDDKQTINRRIPEHLTRLVQSELDTFCATNPEFPVSEIYIHKKRSVFQTYSLK